MCYTNPRWRRGFFLAVFFASSALSFGTENGVPIDTQASYLLQALSYDRKLEKRSKEVIHVGVVYKGDEKVARDVVRAFEKAGKDGVKGLEVKVSAIQFKSVATLLKQIDANRYNVIYIHPSIGLSPAPILQVTRARKIPSLGCSKKMIEQGASLGVYLRNRKPKLVVNLRALQVEGLALRAEILRIATVIK